MQAARVAPRLAALMAMILAAAMRAQDGRTTGQEEEAKRVQARVDLMVELRKLDLTTERGCKAAIVRIDDPASRGIWLGSGLATHVQDLLTRARSNLELLGNKAGTLKVHEEARSFAAAHRDQPREALARYARAEDEVQARLQSAIQQDGELAARSRDDPDLVAAATRNSQLRERLEKHYQQILAESDALCAVAFPAAAIEKAPWIDLLAPDAEWTSSLLAGFGRRIENGAMVIQGPAPAAGQAGVLSVASREGWRDFVVDFELTFTSGSLRMFFRMDPRTRENTENFPLVSSVQGPAPPLHGKTYEGQAWVIGSRFHFHLKVDGLEPHDADIPWRQCRKGAFALVIFDGTKVKFTRLRLRVLR